jgi:hypothetical protein
MPNDKHQIKAFALHLALILAFLQIGTACINEDLSGCGQGPVKKENELVIKLQIHWDGYLPPQIPQGMLINLQSLTPHYTGYGRDYVNGAAFVKYLLLPEETSHLVMAYNYYDCEKLSFFNEDKQSIEARCPEGKRNTYEKLIKQGLAPDEPLITEPDRLLGAHLRPFEVDREKAINDTLYLNLYPDSLSREFTYCIRNLTGMSNLSANGIRISLSGMAGSYWLAQPSPAKTPSTLLIENINIKAVAGIGDLSGAFYSFPPVEGVKQMLCVETLSKGGVYGHAFWDVSSQIAESMADREGKLKRDGYDILIYNSEKELPAIPLPPKDEGSNNEDDGFKVDVGDWNDIELDL